RRAGSKRTVHETLHAADLHPIVPESTLGSHSGQFLPSRKRPAKIDAYSEFSSLGELLIMAKKPAARGRVAAIHILHAGHSRLRRFLDRGSYYFAAFRVPPRRAAPF